MPRWIAQFVLVIALLCGGCATRNKSVPPQLTPFRLALCENYPEETHSLANVRADLRLLETNHITALRVAMGWDGIEPRRGEFYWQFWDEFVNPRTTQLQVAEQVQNAGSVRRNGETVEKPHSSR